MAQINHYLVLQVSANASMSDITAAYRRLCKLYHPDVSKLSNAEERMKQINVAYHILRDENRRREYDRQMRFAAAAPPTPPRSSPQPQATQSPDSKSAGRRWFFSGFRKSFRKKAESTKTEAGQKTDAEKHRREEEAAARQGLAILREYFQCLHEERYENAYQLLCRHDQEAVSLQGFCKWRVAVNKLFEMEGFFVDEGAVGGNGDASAGIFAKSHKHRVTITETNRETGKREQYQCIKYAIPEGGQWRVFLGYQDLGNITRMYEDISRKQEPDEVSRRWEEYCRQTCKDIDMLTMEGLYKEARRELYRCRRYGQQMAVACYNIVPRLGASEEEIADIVLSCANTLHKTLRITDIPAYLGNGLFVVLYIELKKRHAAAIISRTANAMQKDAWSTLGIAVNPRWAWAPYEGGSLKSYLDNLPDQVGV